MAAPDSEEKADQIIDAFAEDLLSDGDLDVTAWTDLEGLPDDLGVLSGQLRAIAGYARTWVCQSAGFEPSDICLLRPLARLMDLLAEGFSELESVAVADLNEIKAGVVDTTADLQALDAIVAERFPVLA